MKKKEKLLNIVMDIYRELYRNSTPTADFDELVKNAEIVDGLKQIPFMDYEIDKDLMMDIINKHLKGKRLTKSEKESIKFEVLLGVSPRNSIVKTTIY